MERKEQNCKDQSTSPVMRKSIILESLFQCYIGVNSYVDSGLQCKIHFLLWSQSKQFECFLARLPWGTEHKAST